VYDNAYSEMTFDGYVAPSIFDVPGALAKVKSFLDTGQFMAVQRAGIAALESWAEWVPGNVEVFRERRDAAVAAFRANGFEIAEAPKASMYLWVPLPSGVPSMAFHERLMEEEGVIVLAGAALGAGGEGFFRVSFIASPERIAEAAARAGKVLRSFSAR